MRPEEYASNILINLRNEVILNGYKHYRVELLESNDYILEVKDCLIRFVSKIGDLNLTCDIGDNKAVFMFRIADIKTDNSFFSKCNNESFNELDMKFHRVITQLIEDYSHSTQMVLGYPNEEYLNIVSMRLELILGLYNCTLNKGYKLYFYTTKVGDSIYININKKFS